MKISLREVFYVKEALNNFVKSTGKHLQFRFFKSAKL